MTIIQLSQLIQLKHIPTQKGTLIVISSKKKVLTQLYENAKLSSQLMDARPCSDIIHNSLRS